MARCLSSGTAYLFPRVLCGGHDHPVEWQDGLGVRRRCEVLAPPENRSSVYHKNDHVCACVHVIQRTGEQEECPLHDQPSRATLEPLKEVLAPKEPKHRDGSFRHSLPQPGVRED